MEFKSTESIRIYNICLWVMDYVWNRIFMFINNQLHPVPALWFAIYKNETSFSPDLGQVTMKT